MDSIKLEAYIDGSITGIGVVLRSLGRTIRISKFIGRQDNNVAEYAESISASKLHVFSDAQVIVRQMTGEYECGCARLYSLNFICRKLARLLDFTISHIRREDNTEAHALAHAAKGIG